MSIKNSFADYDFLSFDNKGNLDINEIALRTKKLVTNSNYYNGYIEKFYNHTKLITFKLPLIKTDQNFNKIKIEGDGLSTNTNSLVKMRISERDIDRCVNNLYFTPIKNFNGDRIKNMKNLKINFRSESVFLDKDSNMFITDPYSNIKLTNSYWNNCNKKKLLSDIQQITENYFNFENSEDIYDQKEIFDKKEFYNKMIREKIFYAEEIRKKTSILRRVFNPGTNKEIMMALHSIELKFTKIDSEGNTSEISGNCSFTLVFPFQMLPIFYNFSFEKFKILLLSGLRFNQSFNEVKIEDSELFSCVKSLLDNQKQTGSEIAENLKRSVDNLYRFLWITPNHKFQVELK